MRVQQQQPRRTYTPEFRADTVALMHRRDCSYREVSEELGVNQFTLRRWYMADLMAKKKGKRPKDIRSPAAGAPAGETAEDQIERLERENAKLLKKVERLEEDRAILKKAAAFVCHERAR